jgi:NTP pyrophosphatase (non-canonical NTP hydrolase)
MSLTITDLVKQAHDNAVSKGFYDCPECGGSESPDGHDCCGGTNYNQDKNIAELLMLIVSELGEAIEAHRKNHNSPVKLLDELLNCNDEKVFKRHFEDLIKDTFQDEISDAVIRIADMCGYLGIDLEKHIELKMKYNATIEYKHGKKY